VKIALEKAGIHNKVFVGKLEGKSDLEDLVVDGRITL
jgi:hypothetical protein